MVADDDLHRTPDTAAQRTEVVGGNGLLANKVLLIAGVGPNIGTSAAMIAAREGAQVALLARSEGRLEQVADLIRKNGGDACALPCDLSKADAVERAVAAALERFGRIDAVFYNAFHNDLKQRDLDIEEGLWDASMNLNIRAAMSIARLTIPGMLERSSGAFVFTSSNAAIVAEEWHPLYGISKAGLSALTRYVASRYGRRGIRANAIYPFVVPGDAGLGIAALSCLKRSATADEVGEVVAFLCSDRSAVITGQDIHVDCGMMIHANWPSAQDSDEGSEALISAREALHH